MKRRDTPTLTSFFAGMVIVGATVFGVAVAIDMFATLLG